MTAVPGRRAPIADPGFSAAAKPAPQTHRRRHGARRNLAARPKDGQLPAPRPWPLRSYLAGGVTGGGMSAFEKRGTIWSMLATCQTAEAITVAAFFTSSGTMRS
jgi:hypothetical protein